MTLLLLRHGDAEDGDGDDDARRLTPKGERQAVAAGEALAALGVEVDACLSSPRVRAAETARLACRALGDRARADRRAARRALRRAGAGGRARRPSSWSATSPTSPDEVARLTGGRVKMKKGGLAIVEGSTLLALLRPDELAAIAASR